MLILKLAYKEILQQKYLALLMIFNIALGLLGLNMIQSFKSSLQESLKENSRHLLTADLLISSRQKIDKIVLDRSRKVIAAVKEAQSIDLFSMMRVKDESRLVYVRAISRGYPLVGGLKLSNGTNLSGENFFSSLLKNEIYIYPELLEQFSLSINDKVALGNAHYQVKGSILEDGAGQFRTFSIAPRVYMTIEALNEAHLLQVGTTATRSYYFLHPQVQNLKNLVSALKNQVNDNTINIEEHESASEQMLRLSSYIGDYMGLAALAGLLLSAIGTAYLMRTWLSRKLREIATFRTLGLSNTKIILIFSLGFLFLCLTAALISFTAARAFNPFLESSLRDFLPMDFHLKSSLLDLVTMSLVGFISGCLASLSVFYGVTRLPVQQIFREQFNPVMERNSWEVLIWIPFVLLFGMLAFWLTSSYIVALLFVLSVVISIVLFSSFFSIFCWWLHRISTHWNYIFRLPILELSRRKTYAFEAVTAIGLGTLLLTLLPQLRTQIRGEIQTSGVVPSLFLFDIQEEQLMPLKELIAKAGHPLQYVSPMVRARLEKINNEMVKEERTFLHSKEEERSNQFRSRTYNLTYKEHLGESEYITRGQALSGHGVEFSLEEGFAERMSIAVGDQLTFDIQGVQITGSVVNLRKVRWSSFQPNFFVVVGPGVLEEAPKIFLASIAKLEAKEKLKIQSKIVKALPNISIIDVDRTVQQLLEMISKIAVVINIIAFLSIFCGIVVLLSVSNTQIYFRRYEIMMLKVLGIKWSHGVFIFMFELGLVLFFSTLMGGFFSLALSQGIILWIFKTNFTPDFALLFWNLLMVLCFGLFVIYISIRRIVNLRAVEVINGY